MRIERKKRFFIPIEYRDSHNYVFELHDILVWIIKNGEKQRVFNAQFKVEAHGDIDGVKELHGEELVEWLISNGYKHIVDELSYKQVYIAVLSDFCHFVYEALKCSEKGKLTVTFALLRKPFKDNLLILEWLLSRPDDFLNNFHNLGPESYAPDKISKEKKLELIKEGEQKSNTGLHLANFIYELRYGKNLEYSLECLWNKATHIVTTFNSYKTEIANLNFIFSDDAAREDQWGYLYMILPLLMYHAVEVALAIFSNMVKFDDNEFDRFRRQFRFILWSEKYFNNVTSDHLNTATNNFIADLVKDFDDIGIECSNCNNNIKINRKEFEQIITDLTLTCEGCGEEYDLSSLIYNKH